MVGKLELFDYWVLTTNDLEEWHKLLGSSPQRDIFFAPEYIIPFESLTGENAYLFCYGSRSNFIIYPFFKRRINDLLFYQAYPLVADTEYSDVASPYGYCGPIAVVDDESIQTELWKNFLVSFNRYCRDENIVCEFARLNPFLCNHVYLQELTDGVKLANRITYLDLSQSKDAIWRGFNRGNRSNINKARNSGVRILRGYDHQHIQRFYELYAATMHRNNASSWYFFSPNFFADIFSLLDDKISLFYAESNDQVIAAASFLHEGDVVHYFLGGSDADSLDLRPNNLLIFQAILWAKSQGFSRFNLGGGYKCDDGLARFKKGFSRLSKSFYIYRMVHMPEVYNELYHRYARFKGFNRLEEIDYFPAYRYSVPITQRASQEN